MNEPFRNVFAFRIFGIGNQLWNFNNFFLGSKLLGHVWFQLYNALHRIMMEISMISLLSKLW